MNRFHMLSVGAVCVKVLSNQSILLRNYFTGSYDEHANADVICDRLLSMQDLREANVFGISVVDDSVCIDYFYDYQVELQSTL